MSEEGGARVQLTAEESRTAACAAVATSMPPRMRNVIAASATWPTQDRVADVAFMIETRMANKADLDRTLPWWEASGDAVTAALVDVSGTEQGLASHIIGAVVEARILGGQPLVEDLVLRWAERAAAWIDGNQSSQKGAR